MTILANRGERAERLSDELGRLVRGRLTRPPPRVLGVEHEFAVYTGGERVHFAELIHELELGGVPLHPTKREMYLTPTGVAVMSDGGVAETATPPLPCTRTVASDVAAWAERGRQQVLGALPAGHEMFGGSTHLSIATDRRYGDRVAVLFARTFAAPLMLLMDRDYSPGLLVRPRPGRTELCGEYLAGTSLEVATAFALSAVVALERAVVESAEWLPPPLDVTLEPGRRRYGWYVDRAAFGTDLYAQGRDTSLRIAGGGTVDAGAYLAHCWAIVRPIAVGMLARRTVDLVERVVDGRLPIPLERDPDDVGHPARPGTSVHPFGAALTERRRNGVTVQPRLATWDWVAFEVTGADRSVVANVPRGDLDSFLRKLDSGRLDRAIAAYVALEPADRTLNTHAQTATIALFDSVAPGPALLPQDRYGVGSGEVSASRPGKVLPALGEQTSGGAATRTGTIAALLAAFVLVLAGITLAGNAIAGAGLASPTIEDFIGPDVDVVVEGDGTVADDTGDAVEYYGTGDPSEPDASGATWQRIMFGPEFGPEARAARLAELCTAAAAGGSQVVCGDDPAVLADAPEWVLMRVDFTGVYTPFQVGVVWLDEGRPAFEGPDFDPNTGRNTSLEIFAVTPGEFMTGTTRFDGGFSAGPSNDIIGLVTETSVTLLLNAEALANCTNPRVFVVGPGGADFIDLPEQPASTVTVGAPPPTTTTTTVAVAAPSTTAAATTPETTRAVSAPETTGAPTATDPSGTSTTTDDGGGLNPLLVLIGIVLLGVIGYGIWVFVNRKPDGTIPPVLPGFEKGHGTYVHVG